MIQVPLRMLLTGGLGNQLFQTAAAYYIQALTRREFVLVRDANSYSKYNHGSRVEKLIKDLSVEGKEESLDLLLRFDRKLVRSSRVYADLRRIQVHQELGFDPELVIKDHIHELRGYFQSYIYAESLRGIYQESISYYLKNSQPKVALTNSSPPRPVSLHMRRGDYEILKTTFGVLDFEYYENALEELDSHEKIEEIWVFSDDVPKAKSTLSRSRFSKFMNFQLASNLGEVDSLAAMSICSRHIIANSTFSWWGAFLTGGQRNIIAPDKWFRNGEDPYKLIPHNWTQIESKWEL
jgi:hypothetical protein